MTSGIIKYLALKNESLIVSYKALRRLIGIMGILLPIINILGGCFIAKLPIQQSISMYYYTNMRDFFVGLMFVVSLFLITYKGYNTLDLITSIITGAAGLGVAIFPCFSEMYIGQKVGIFQLSPETSFIVHLTCAALFFVLLAFTSVFLFTRKHKDSNLVTPQKRIRNIIYVVCGILMLACVLGMLLSILILTKEQRYDSKIILILESIALFSFGVSWLVKGETLFRDK